MIRRIFHYVASLKNSILKNLLSLLLFTFLLADLLFVIYLQIIWMLHEFGQMLGLLHQTIS
jgi:hypothetical protein